MTFKMYISLFILSLPLLIMIARKIHLNYLLKKNSEK